MTPIKPFSRNTVLLCVLLFGSCTAKSTTSEITLAGSTPADKLIKTMLAIPLETKVDFIKWNLVLNDKSTFSLDVAYGESQPNTLGFKKTINGTFKGTFAVSESGNFKEVWYLKSSGFSTDIPLVKLSANVFHLLTPQNQMMLGNGGWSYTLNRKDWVSQGDILISSMLSADQPLQLVFDGRTPCQEIAEDHPEMNTSKACFKLKWRLILYRDSITHLPTTYTIRKVVDNEPRDVSGKWTIIKGTKTNQDITIYTIDPDKPDESMSLLVGDDNVLFFLDKDNTPYIGNGDFSFTMNRKIQ